MICCQQLQRCLYTGRTAEAFEGIESKYLKDNERIWDKRSDNHDKWSVPVSSEEINEARRGKWKIVLTPEKAVPRDWFPESMEGIKILCLASGGGQQGPILSAAGADVTVFDNSSRQLEKDRFAAERENLRIRTVQGNMQDLSAFGDGSFDLIVHPWSNDYVDDILPVWKECSRVLKDGGTLLAGFGSPIGYVFDPVKLEEGRLELKYSIPYADTDHPDDEKICEIAAEEGYCWGHTVEDQIQGQISAGFVIAGFYEDVGCAPFNGYMNTSMATRAIKCGSWTPGRASRNQT